MSGPYWNPDTADIVQPNNWTCSTTSLTWLLRAMGRNPSVEWITQAMGDGISEANGLEDATGAGLARLINTEYGEMFEATTRREPISWVELQSLLDAGYHVLIGGAKWYHWCAVRGENQTDDSVWIMNPAGVYKGVREYMNEKQFMELGPFHALIVRDLRADPPPDPTPLPAPGPTLEERVARLEARFDRLREAVTSS